MVHPKPYADESRAVAGTRRKQTAQRPSACETPTRNTGQRGKGRLTGNYKGCYGASLRRVLVAFISSS